MNAGVAGGAAAAGAAGRGDLPLQAEHPELHGVATDDLEHGRAPEADIRPGQAALLDLLGDQEVLGNAGLPVLRVSGDMDDLYTVAQGVGDVVRRVTLLCKYRRPGHPLQA